MAKEIDLLYYILEEGILCPSLLLPKIISLEFRLIFTESSEISISLSATLNLCG